MIEKVLSKIVLSLFQKNRLKNPGENGHSSKLEKIKIQSMTGHKNGKYKKRLINFTLFIGSCIVSLVMLEVLLGFFFPKDEYKIWYPNLEFSFDMQRGLLPGVDGRVEFQTNGEGMIGDAISNTADFRILTIGGSTTECLMLGSEGGWPYLLQSKLNKSYANRQIWIGNLGRSGLHSEDHILALKHLIPELPKIDALIILVGANDLQKRMTLQKDYASFEDPELYSHAFHIYPNRHNGSFLKRTNVWALIKKIKKQYDFSKNQEMSHDEVESFFLKNRMKRKESPKVDTLPDLTNAANEYKRRILEIIKIARSQKIRIIFLTQPTIWKENFPENWERYLLTGGVNIPGTSKRAEYYSVEALMKGMEIYNQRVIEACAESDVEIIDLASMIPKDTTYFYDDMHFNKKGATEISSIMTHYFKEIGM